MAIDDVLRDLRADPQFMASVAAWRTLPAESARLEPFPTLLNPALAQLLERRGIDRLYSHQRSAVDAALAGQNVAVVTPTASGKTLCYNLPVLHALLGDAGARALYLFPTKALAQDQLSELRIWSRALAESGADDGLTVATYDGDTPSAQRAAIRRHSRLILTNPDMLHTGILPYHTNWHEFLHGLRFVVIDEMHTYRGVFGSHVANVLRRLRRICERYGAQPRFVCTSATIANPGELAGNLLEGPVTLVEENGAPRGEKHIILYNPPVYDQERGLRRSSTLESQELAARCVLGGVQTIVFGRSRLTTEVLLSYLRERVSRHWRRESVLNSPDPEQVIRGYRGGYLPTQRRAIEAGLRDGEVQAVVATNALELGIDIGRLQAAVLCGYPGSIASSWQQMGRAGRTRETSLAVLVATGGVLDQYVMQHPEFLFGRSPEHAFINPDNLMLLVDQVRCAAFESPFVSGEQLGTSTFTGDVLELLSGEGELQQAGGRYFWSGDGYPSRAVSLRSAGNDPVVIQAKQGAEALVIGEVDHLSATLLVHDGAIYLHEGEPFQVNRLDLEENLAHVTPVEVDYYTEANIETNIEVLAEHERRGTSGGGVAHGDLMVASQVVGFRRIKRFTHETVGVQPLDYPPYLLETSGYWFTVGEDVQLTLARAGRWFDGINDYGPNWQEQRKRVRTRDGFRCRQCGAPEPGDRQHDVHHLIPFRTFGYIRGINENHMQANRLDNLLLVCRNCHRRLESTVRVRGALDGLAYALTNLAPLHLMCDPKDIDVAVVRGPNEQGRAEEPGTEEGGADETGERLPTVYIYERATAGLGFSVRLFELHERLLEAAQALIGRCPCPRGCPACVGPVLEHEQVSLETKALTRALLEVMVYGRLDGAPAQPDEVDFGF